MDEDRDENDSTENGIHHSMHTEDGLECFFFSSSSSNAPIFVGIPAMEMLSLHRIGVVSLPWVWPFMVSSFWYVMI